MKRMIKQLIVAGLGLAVLTTPAFGQGGLLIGGGLTMPKGDFADVAKSGYHGMAALEFGSFGVPLALRAEGAYHLNDFDVSGNPDAKVNTITASGDLVYAFAVHGVGPYILGGITWGSVKCKGNDCASDASHSDTGYNLGGGINFGGIFAEAKYVSIGGDVNENFVPITIGFHF